MQTVDDTLTLLKRQLELDNRMKQPGGIRTTEERELHRVRQRLTVFPEAMKTVLQAARALRRPVTDLNAPDIEAWATTASDV